MQIDGAMAAFNIDGIKNGDTVYNVTEDRYTVVSKGSTCTTLKTMGRARLLLFIVVNLTKYHLRNFWERLCKS